MNKIIEFLDCFKIEYIKNFEISSISSIKLGEILPLAIFPKNIKEFKLILKKLSSKKIYFKVIGNATNILFETSPNYPVVITNKMANEIKVDENKVTVSAGVLLSKLSDCLRKNALSGIEGVSGIPATIGGAIFMGAGAFGCNIFDKLESIEVFNKNKFELIDRKFINFKHHYSNLDGLIIISAIFLFEKKSEYDIINMLAKFSYLRTSSQPIGLSLGSIFKQIDGKSAGFYIERSGLKGIRFGGIFISNKHANFIVNDGSGTINDFLRMMAFIKKEVDKNFGICLTTEIEQVGEKNETFGRLPYTFKKL